METAWRVRFAHATGKGLFITGAWFPQLPAYVANGESVLDADVVLWHISPAHHLPRSEDGEFKNGVFNGSALLMWGGFDLRPRNFFDRTPFYP